MDMGTIVYRRCDNGDDLFLSLVPVRTESARELKLTNYSQRKQRYNTWLTQAFKHSQHQSTSFKAFPWYY